MAMKSSLNSPRSLLRRGKLLILSNQKIRRAANLRPALRQLFSKIVHQLWRRMVVELFGSSEGEFFLLPWREKAMMRGHNRHPHLHPYIRFVADCHRGDHCYVTPISRTCWNEDHLHPIPNYEDQGETVPSSERTELKVQ